MCTHSSAPASTFYVSAPHPWLSSPRRVDSHSPLCPVWTSCTPHLVRTGQALQLLVHLPTALAHLCSGGLFAGILSVWKVYALGLVSAGHIPTPLRTCPALVCLHPGGLFLVWQLCGLGSPANLSTTPSATVRSEPQLSGWGTLPSLSFLRYSPSALKYPLRVLFTLCSSSLCII